MGHVKSFWVTLKISGSHYKSWVTLNRHWSRYPVQSRRGDQKNSGDLDKENIEQGIRFGRTMQERKTTET